MSIKKININGTQHDLIASGLTDTSAEKIKLDATNIAYGTCSTAAGTAAKVVTLSGNTQWELKVGSLVTVKFTATNTAESPTLNVDSTGAYPIYYNASEYTSASSYGGYANRHITYQFNGTHWVFISWSYDSNSDTKVTQAAAITTAGEYPVMLGYSTSTSSVTNTLKKTSTLKYNPSTQILTAPTFKGNLTGNVTGNADTATTADSATTLTGLTATVAELNKLDGVTATTAELNYVDGVTSSIQTQLDGKAASGHTHTQASMGQGYGTCATAAATAAKVVTLSGYTLVTGGIVSVKFTNSVPASATMNINSKGAKAIYYKGKAIVDGVICAGEVATFQYDGSYYHLIAVDRNRFYTSLVPYGTAIVAATEATTVDLSAAAYQKVGNYFCSSNANAKYITNIPITNKAFMMQVYSPLSQTVDNETGTWVYRLRKITFYTGEEYIQYNYTNGTGGNWLVGAWQKYTVSSDLTSYATKTYVDDAIATAMTVDTTTTV